MGKAKGSQQKLRERKRSARKALTFRFFVAVCLLLAGMALFILVQHQFAVSNGVKVRAIEEEVTQEKSKQRQLRTSLARLKSPARIMRIAQDELGFGDPAGVVYLRYSRDSEGNMVCRSSYEKRKQSPPEKIRLEDADQVPAEDEGSPLTRR